MVGFQLVELSANFLYSSNCILEAFRCSVSLFRNIITIIELDLCGNGKKTLTCN